MYQQHTAFDLVTYPSNAHGRYGAALIGRSGLDEWRIVLVAESLSAYVYACDRLADELDRMVEQHMIAYPGAIYYCD